MMDKPAGAGGAIQAIATARDRDRAFRAARRHTRVVRSLRLLLPAAAVMAFAAFSGKLLIDSWLRPAGITLGPVRIDTKNLTMETPRYEGFGKDGSAYKVRAREAITDLRQTGPVRLNEIEGVLTQTTGVVTNLQAVWGTYDQKQDILELYERIDVEGSTGMKARLSRATVFTKESRVVSDEPVWARNETGVITARSMVLEQRARKAAFKDDVHVTLASSKPAKAEAETAATAQPVATPRSKGPMAAMPTLSASSGKPIEVRSATLDVDDGQRTALFRQNVVATQGDARLEAPELDVLYEGKAAMDSGAAPKAGEEPTRLKTIRARGGVVARNKDDTATSATLDYDAATEKAHLKGNVVITSTSNRRATADDVVWEQRTQQTAMRGNVVVHTSAEQKATADALDYDQKNEKAVLKGRVMLESGADRKVVGDHAEFDQKADTALVTGDEVVATQARNVLKGRRIMVDRKAGTTRLESPAADGKPAGRINTVFYQNDKGDAGKPGATKAANGEAGGANPLAVNFKTDPNAPIEVDADTLDVFDLKKQALFKGSVVAKQGDFIVRTVEMTAHYTGNTGLGDVSAPLAAPKEVKDERKAAKDKKGKGADGTGEGAQLTRIQARQNVVVTSSDGREVVGDWADYDVKANQMTVGGSVSVTNGKSVIKGPEGSRLVIDMTTGLSEMQSGTSATAPATGQAKPAVSAAAPATSAGAAPSRGSAPTQSACPEGQVCTRQRVQAVLYPDEVKEKAKKKIDDVAKDGWVAESGKDGAREAVEKRGKDKRPSRKPEASGWESSTSATGARQ